MYTTLLFIHSWLRWVVLILALVAIVKSFTGWKGSKTYSSQDNKIAVFFMASMHLMLIIGLGLYFISPYAFNAFGGSESVMKNATLRFWAVEHIFVMILATVAATIGRIKAKKKELDNEKFKTQFTYFLIALIFMLSRIPWGEADRLFRM
jgi:hypothetical protein